MNDTIAWDEIKKILHQDLMKIFKNEDINILTDYEKRKMIFEYLTENISYDYEKLENIRNIKLGNIKRINRDLKNELINIILSKKGICNSISQYYKLLLEQVGIDSYCVVCDDGTEVNHQLNIIKDNITGNYSFDDVTSVVVKRGTKEDFFDYDIEEANNHQQGLRNTEVYETPWVVIPNELIYFYVNRNEEAKELNEFPIDKIVKSNKSKIK